MIRSSIARAVSRLVTRPVNGAIESNFDQLIKSLFANGEQGFFYDPNDLSTMFQDAAGTVPVTGAGQPVGLMLDKSRGLVLGGEMVTVSTVNGLPANGSFQYYSMAGKIAQLVARKAYKITYTISDYSGTDNVGLAGSAPAGVIQQSHSSNGSYSSIQIPTTNGYFVLYTGKASTANFSNISVKEIAGNHASQTTSSMRPLLVASPQRLNYDTADDKLITALPAQLTGCTVVRAVPNVGTQILTGQTIPTPYNDNTDHCGLIVINRALTPNETSAITAEFNKRAGV